MWSYLFSESKSPKKTRFTETEFLNGLLSFLSQLRDQEKNLKTEVTDLAIQKRTIISELLKKLDGEIDQFNQSQIASVLPVISAMQEMVELCLETNKTILNEPRSSSKQMVRGTIGTVTFTTGVVSSVVMGNIPGVLGAVVITKPVSDATMAIAGVKDERTTSVQILEGLVEELNTISKKLEIDQELKERSSQKQSCADSEERKESATEEKERLCRARQKRR